jgi:hypothetical protein
MSIATILAVGVQQGVVNGGVERVLHHPDAGLDQLAAPKARERAGVGVWLQRHAAAAAGMKNLCADGVCPASKAMASPARDRPLASSRRSIASR